MNTGLSFRKESIQQSSSMSAALHQKTAEVTNAQGPRAARELPAISLSTLFTLTQP